MSLFNTGNVLIGGAVLSSLLFANKRFADKESVLANDLFKVADAIATANGELSNNSPWSMRALEYDPFVITSADVPADISDVEIWIGRSIQLINAYGDDDAMLAVMQITADKKVPFPEVSVERNIQAASDTFEIYQILNAYYSSVIDDYDLAPVIRSFLASTAIVTRALTAQINFFNPEANFSLSDYVVSEDYLRKTIALSKSEGYSFSQVYDSLVIGRIDYNYIGFVQDHGVSISNIYNRIGYQLRDLDGVYD